MNPRQPLDRLVSGPPRHRSARLSAALWLLAVSFAAAVHADHKNVPGSICHGVTYGTMDFDPLKSSIASSDPNVDRKIVCPLIRDNGEQGILGPDFKVYVYNGSGEGNVTCRLKQALPQSETVQEFSTSPRSATKVGLDVLDFSTVTGAQGLAFMTYFVECDLPARDPAPPIDPDTGLPTDGISRVLHLSYEENAEHNAEDHKLFPGALCMPVTGNPAGWLRYEDTSGDPASPAGLMGTVHAAGGGGYVVCPIVRDSVAIDNGLAFAAVAVSDRQWTSLKDEPEAQEGLEVFCELFQYDALTGTATPLDDNQSIYPDHQSGTKYQGYRTFTMEDDLAIDAGMQYYYALLCSVAQEEGNVNSVADCRGGSCWSGILSYGLWEVPEEGFTSSGGKDWKTFTGAFCKRTPSVLDPTATPSTEYTAAGEIENPVGEAATVTCPVLRDSTLGGSLASAVVYVEDGNTTEDVSCSFRVRRGDRQDDVQAETRSSTGTGRQALSFAVDGLGAGGTVGFYAIDCQLPAEDQGNPSRVISYGIQENLPTQ